jgi:CDP-diacylglycerol--glycerol-3-phosphate 3-phosphatidyltransferase/cardiolipin synthase
MLNLPNLFLFYRLLAVPLFVVCYACGWQLAALIIFATAAISDFFDGYFARRLHLVNDFGKLMDPLADKILTAAAFICLSVAGLVPAWMVVVIIAREYLITGLRGLAAAHHRVIAARFSGKLKTVAQMLASLVLLVIGAHLVSDLLLWLALALTIYSGIEYCYDCRQLFRQSSRSAKQPARK